MIYIGFSNKLNKYLLVQTNIDICELCEKYNFADELYRIVDENYIEILDTDSYEFVEFRGIFSNPELFDICKNYLKTNVPRYLYHHISDDSYFELIKKEGLKATVGELYQSYAESYLDEFEDINDFALPDKYDDNIENWNLVPGIFLCSDIDYDITEEPEEIILKIDTSKLSNDFYKDFNETRNDCFFTTDNIPFDAIVEILTNE